jgi:hypothetical protein
MKQKFEQNGTKRHLMEQLILREKWNKKIKRLRTMEHLDKEEQNYSYK